MITLYGFGRIFPEGVGETKDLRAQWALEETGLPYRVHALDHTGGELDSDAYTRIKAYYERCVARSARQRTLDLYAERLGVSVDDIR